MNKIVKEETMNKKKKTIKSIDEFNKIYFPKAYKLQIEQQNFWKIFIKKTLISMRKSIRKIFKEMDE